MLCIAEGEKRPSGLLCGDGLDSLSLLSRTVVPSSSQTEMRDYEEGEKELRRIMKLGSPHTA